MLPSDAVRSITVLKDANGKYSLDSHTLIFKDPQKSNLKLS